MNDVWFGGKWAYKEWGLLLKSRPVVSFPEPKTNYIDIPEADGILDLSESLTGDIKYENRKITFEFNVIEARKRWAFIYSEIANYLHGKKMKIILHDDRSFYYVGRAKINEWKSDKKHSVLVIEADVEPYKMERYSSRDAWKWDSFNFENGIIREYDELLVDGTLTLVIPARRKQVTPEFICGIDVNYDGDFSMKVTFGGKSYTLTTGWNRIVNIVLPEGDNKLKFTGHGIVGVDYRGGSL